MITFKFVDGYISPVLSTGDIIEVDGSYFEIAEPVNSNTSKTLKNNKQDERGEQAKSMVEEEGIYFY